MQSPATNFMFFEIVVLVFSIVIHEVSHGYVADLLGDPTARLKGRLTLNPLKHIDPVGSIIVPIVTALGGFAFGWAKPVPFNPHNLKNRRVGELLIALAGPGSNIVIALVFSGVIRLVIALDNPANYLVVFATLSFYIVLVNLSLAIFNLVPIPPLDGSKILFSLLPQSPAMLRVRRFVEMYSLVFLLLLVLVLWQFIAPLIPWFFRVFTGIPL